MKKFDNQKQFKYAVKKYAAENGITGNQIGILWKEIVLDDLLERISLSKYRDNFILKGGFLLASIVGINSRSTEDIDTEIKGFDLTLEQITKIFNEICQINPEDNDPFRMKLIDCRKIHENDTYKGYRLHVSAIAYENLRFNIKVDVSTGDQITPKEVKFKHKLILENREINIWVYNLETIVAEKLESIITRNVFGTRLKDYFDLYILQNYTNKMDFNVLKKAFVNTCQYRKVAYCKDGVLDFRYCMNTVNLIAKNSKMQSLWNRYARSHDFVENISFKDTINAVKYWINIIKN